MLVKSQFKVAAGDFVISKRQIVHQACGIVPSKLDGSIVSNEYDVFQPSEECCIRFFDYFCYRPQMRHALFLSCVGVHLEKMLFKTNDWLKRRFYVPSFPEQRKMSGFLTTVDLRIQQLNQKKVLLEEYKKGVMQRIFTQEIRFRDEHGDKFPEWKEMKLGQAVTVNPKTSHLPESFVYIDLESVNAGVLHSPRRIAKVDAPSRAQRLLCRGDILFQTVRPSQMNNYLFDLEGVYVASTGYAQLRTTKNNARFIYHSLHLSAFVRAVMIRCTGTGYPAINSNILAEIKIAIPCLAEQNKIANFLTTLDRKIESVANQITQTQAFKKGLLQQMFV